MTIRTCFSVCELLSCLVCVHLTAPPYSQLTASVRSLSDNTGILLLCEVAAKPFYERLDAEYDADQYAGFALSCSKDR